MSNKSTKQKRVIHRISFIWGERIEFYTPFTLQECTVHLLSNWSSDYKYFTVTPWRPMIKLDYLTPVTEDNLKFKVSARFGEGTRGERTVFKGNVRRIDDTSTLVIGKIVSPIVMLVGLGVVFLIMGYAFLGMFVLKPDIGGFILLCGFLSIFLITSWMKLSHQRSLQSVLIEAVYKVLSSDVELPLSVGA